MWQPKEYPRTPLSGNSNLAGLSLYPIRSQDSHVYSSIQLCAEGCDKPKKTACSSLTAKGKRKRLEEKKILD